MFTAPITPHPTSRAGKARTHRREQRRPRQVKTRHRWCVVCARVEWYSIQRAETESNENKHGNSEQPRRSAGRGEETTALEDKTRTRQEASSSSFATLRGGQGRAGQAVCVVSVASEGSPSHRIASFRLWNGIYVVVWGVAARAQTGGIAVAVGIEPTRFYRRARAPDKRPFQKQNNPKGLDCSYVIYCRHALCLTPL